MKQRTIYFFALLFLSMCISIKLQGQTFTYKKSASSKYIQYNSNDIKSTVGNNTYTTSMGVSVSNGILPSIRISMTVIGDKSFIDLFRLHKIDTESSHITYANIILENGVTIYNCKSAIIDDTNRDRAKDYLAIGVIMIGTHDLSIIKKLRSYNIKEVTIEGHTINFEKLKFKSAVVIEGACKEIEKEGYSFETAKVDNNFSTYNYGNNIDSNFAKKNKSALDLVYLPFGFLEKDGKGIDNYKTMLDLLKSKTNWKYDEYDNFFVTWNYDGLGFFYDNIKITNAGAYFPNEKFLYHWEYHIDLINKNISLREANNVAKKFINELLNDGFNVKYSNAEDEKIDAILNKGSYHVSVILFYTSDRYWINVRSYPRYN